MSTASEPDTVTGVVPELAAEQDELKCPVCDYSLRGLPEPRCPECGYTFDWEELRERTRLRRSWFYEHAETLRSHLKTRWRSLRPKAFWAEIGAYTFANPKRLRRYQWGTLLLMLLAALPLALPTAIEALRDQLPRARFVTATTLPTSGQYQLIRQFVMTPSGPRSVSWYSNPPGMSPPSQQAIQYHYYVPPPRWAEWLDGFFDGGWVRKSQATAWVAIGFGLAIPLVLPAYWLLLSTSVIHAGVKPVHLRRVGAYTTDAVPWLLGLAAVLGMILFAGPLHSLGYDFGNFGAGVVLAAFLPSVVVGALTWRLSSALRQYVRFPHARPVAWGFGVMVWLAWMASAINASN